MNIIEYLAKGGTATSSKMIEQVQQILGVNDEEMAQLWQIGLDNYGSDEGVAEAISTTIQNLGPKATNEAIKEALFSVFTPQEEQIFKKGGKMEFLCSKFKKGGRCGCKKAKNGDELDNPYEPNIPWQIDTSMNYIPALNKSLNESAKRIGNIVGGTAGATAGGAVGNYILNNGINFNPSGVWYPEQARVGTWYSPGNNGALRFNATGRYVPPKDLNTGQYSNGTDFARTMQNNLNAIKPMGFKKGGTAGPKRFNNLPTEVYNENGVLIGNEDDPEVQNFIRSRKQFRTYTFADPTIEAQLNNNINQAPMLWNPQNLPEPRRYDVWTRGYDPSGDPDLNAWVPELKLTAQANYHPKILK